MNFEHIDRKKYRRSFLQQVELMVEYPQVNDFEDKLDILMASFEGQGGFWEKGYKKLIFKSPDAYFRLLITNKGMAIQTDCQGYRGFETMLGLFDNCRRMLDILCEGDFLKVQLRKINILPFHKEKEGPSILILNEMFSDSLRCTQFGKSQLEQEVKSYYTDCCFKHEKGTIYLKYGFDSRRDNDQYVFVVLDTTMQSRACAKQEAHEVLFHLNEVLFDVFHWAVTDNIIKEME